MPGLDTTIIENFDQELALGRIQTDLKTDFILSPHYAAIYEFASEALWDRLLSNLRSGTYEPSLPIIMEVPKETLISRPGAILNPYDRLAYQLVIDLIAPKAEAHLNRERTFSHRLLDPDPDHRMFEESHIAYDHLQSALKSHGEDSRYPFAIKGDIASFFERVYQHNIINLLHSAGCSSSSVSFLEKILLAWSEKDSHGIPQGLFPSDFLGNFSLCGLDSNLEVMNIPSARYVDDLYLFFPSEEEARIGLTRLCMTLRKEGLNLNELKTKILGSHQLIREETQIDILFQEAREEIESELYGYEDYGFQNAWLNEDGEPNEKEIELAAVESLYLKIDEFPSSSDRIEKFCLPPLAAGQSEIAVDKSLQNLFNRPHMAKVYCSYLVRLAAADNVIAKRIHQLFQENNFPYEWQLMWIIATLLHIRVEETRSSTKILQILSDYSFSSALRAICALYIGRHGNPGQKRNLTVLYGSEPSEYVKGAILFAARFYSSSEKRTRLTAWGGHCEINSLIAKAVNALNH